jgi:hypothetical protein
MLDLQNKKLVQMVSVMSFVILVYQGYEIRKLLLEKADAQQTVVDALVRFSQQYVAGLESRARWEKQYPKIGSVSGAVGLIEHVNFAAYGLDVDPDKVKLVTAEEITLGGQAAVPLGLVNACLATASGERNVLEVSAPSYQALMNGIDKLAHRADIAIGNISVRKGDLKNPVGRLGDFCILMRSD